MTLKGLCKWRDSKAVADINSHFLLHHAGLQEAFDEDWQAGRLNSVGYLNGTEDGILAYKLLIQTGSEKEPLNYNLVCPPG